MHPGSEPVPVLSALGGRGRVLASALLVRLAELGENAPRPQLPENLAAHVVVGDLPPLPIRAGKYARDFWGDRIWRTSDADFALTVDPREEPTYKRARSAGRRRGHVGTRYLRSAARQRCDHQGYWCGARRFSSHASGGNHPCGLAAATDPPVPHCLHQKERSRRPAAERSMEEDKAADVLRIPLGTVKSRLHEAMSHLRKSVVAAA